MNGLNRMRRKIFSNERGALLAISDMEPDTLQSTVVLKYSFSSMLIQHSRAEDMNLPGKILACSLACLFQKNSICFVHFLTCVEVKSSGCVCHLLVINPSSLGRRTHYADHDCRRYLPLLSISLFPAMLLACGTEKKSLNCCVIPEKLLKLLRKHHHGCRYLLAMKSAILGTSEDNESCQHDSVSRKVAEFLTMLLVRPRSNSPSGSSFEIERDESAYTYPPPKKSERVVKWALMSIL